MKDPREIEERQKLFNQMDSPFKNRVVRYTEPVYKILDARPVNLNEGRHAVKYGLVDVKPKETDFNIREK